MPRTPMRVASKFLGAITAQYVAAETHMRWTAMASMASNGNTHQGSLENRVRN